MTISTAVLKFFPNTTEGKSKYVSTLFGKIVFPDQELEQFIEANFLSSNLSLRVAYLERSSIVMAHLPPDFDSENPLSCVVYPEIDPYSRSIGALIDFPNFASSLEALKFEKPIEIFNFLVPAFKSGEFSWVRFFYSFDELTPFARKILMTLKSCGSRKYKFIEIEDKIIKKTNGESFLKRRTDIALAADFAAEALRTEVDSIVLFSGDADFLPYGQLWIGDGRYEDLRNPQKSLMIVSSQDVVAVELRELSNNPNCLMIFLENIVGSISGQQLSLSF